MEAFRNCASTIIIIKEREEKPCLRCLFLANYLCNKRLKGMSKLNRQMKDEEWKKEQTIL